MASDSKHVQERVRSLLARAQELRAAGDDEATNPELKSIIQELRDYQMKIKMLKQQQQELKTARPEDPKTDDKPVKPTKKAGRVETVDGIVPDPQAAFTPAQVQLLKLQIHAYRLLSKNLPVRDSIRRAIFSTGALDKFGTPVPAVSMGTRLVEQTTLGATSELEALQTGKYAPTQGLPLFHVSAESDPYRFLPKEISYYQHRIRAQRMLVPSVMPVPLDVDRLLGEQELQKRLRIESRIKELEELPGNLSQETLPGAAPTTLKIQALVELKGLRLLERQRRLRDTIVRGLSRSTTLLTALDRSACKRVRPPSLRDARSTEQFEKRQRVEREKKEKNKHLEQVTNILTHGQKLLLAHRAAAKRAVQLGNAVARYHAVCEKEEQKRLQRIAQERLRALKADDEEAYLRLLDKNKDKRIVHLLQATQSYLNDLATSVLSQQEAIAEGEELDAALGDGSAVGVGEVGMDDDMDRRDYFHITHRYKEAVTKQPSMLVGGTLKDYQLKGLEWMISLYNNRLNGILADEMGLGKTIQTISLICHLIEVKKQPGPFLIIVPLSTITNWTLEFERWAPSINKIVYKGHPTQRRELQAEIRLRQFSVLLTTYEYISRDKHVLGKIKWVHVIIDEGHRLKNAKSTLAVTLSTAYQFRYRLILTGTPLQNNLPELWALLNFVLPKIFNSVKSFDEWFNSPFSGMGSGNERLELNDEEQLLVIRRLHKVLRPFLLRRLKKDVEADLPDKVEMVLKCRLSLLQAKLYEMVRTGTLVLKDDDTKAVRVSGLNNRVMQMRKICNHPFVFREIEDMLNPNGISDAMLYRTAGKFELLDRILPKFKATGHRVLMFFQMTAIMDIMEDYLRFRQLQYLRLDGSTKTEERQRMLIDFNAPDSPYDVFLLSTRAGGLGLNLQTADTVIIFDSDWNPHQDLQAQDRAHRIGQTKEVRVLRLVTAKSVEEHILTRAQYKLDMDDKVIQAGKFDNRTSNEEREAYLKALIQGEDVTQNDEDDEGDLADEDINDLIARNDEELVIFARLDRERAAAETAEFGKGWTRLISEKELPPFYTKNMEQIREEIDQSHELGERRARREVVSYKEDIPEDRYLQLIEEGHTPDEIQVMYAEKRKRREEAKRQREAQRAAAAAGDGDEGVSGAEDAVKPGRRAAAAAPSDGSPAAGRGPGRPPGKRRGRPSKQMMLERQREQERAVSGNVIVDGPVNSIDESAAMSAGDSDESASMSDA